MKKGAIFISLIILALSVLTFFIFNKMLKITKRNKEKSIEKIVTTNKNLIEKYPLLIYKTEKPIYFGEKQIMIPHKIDNKKTEFRGAWVVTVDNIVFPCKKGLSEEKIKEEYLKILDKFQDLNMNTIIFQVRPKGDAFYDSKLNPWSEFITGVEGKSPGWDPLRWMIEETHKRNIEFHAWFNPYRVTTTYSEGKTKEKLISSLSKNNWARNHKNYVLMFDGKLLLNPGEPEVQKYVTQSVIEVVKNYDIDGVHFDDYFYPYKSFRNNKRCCFGDKNEDMDTFNKYGKNFKSIEDWRRNNINSLIQTVSKEIKKSKSYVKFGVSPHGIWGSYEIHSKGSKEGEGSHTHKNSISTYDDIYADTRLWVKESYIDYIIPQVYWSFAEKSAPYAELVNWWVDVVKGTNCHLYMGHANYKYYENSKNDENWQNPEEIPNQMRFNSLYDDIKGECFFNFKSLEENKFGVTDIIKKELFNRKVLPPDMPWIKDTRNHK